MRIVEVTSDKENDGLGAFSMRNLGDIVILAGSNGSGKTRLLRLIENYIVCLKKDEKDSSLNTLSMQFALSDKKIALNKDNASGINIIDYSFYDAQLQSPEKFPPYVVHKAKEHLKKCDIRETALNALLFLRDISKGYSPEYSEDSEFVKFCQYAKDFGLCISRDKDNNPLIFNRPLDDARLSPGQQYLLRMVVALYLNVFDSNNILFMDEPEIHLHPDALVILVSKLRLKAPDVQIWIATHSLALVAYLTFSLEYRSSIFHMENGKIKRFGSDSERLIHGMLGGEHNRFMLQQLLVSVEVFACNRFAIECMFEPSTLPSTDKTTGDPQAEITLGSVKKPAAKVFDYGAGQGRLLHELYKCNAEAAGHMTYYAYDLNDRYSQSCKNVLKSHEISESHYFNVFAKVHSGLKNSIDYVFLVNVLHEIPPDEWVKLFKEISSILNENGELVIVEKEELTYGEHAYDTGFLVLTKVAFESMVPGWNSATSFEKSRDCTPAIIRFVLQKSLLNIDDDSIIKGLIAIRDEAKAIIRSIKQNANDSGENKKFKEGIRLAFWTHQFANATLSLESMQSKKKFA